MQMIHCLVCIFSSLSWFGLHLHLGGEEVNLEKEIGREEEEMRGRIEKDVGHALETVIGGGGKKRCNIVLA